MLKTEEILGVKITTNSEEEILEYVLSELDKGKERKKKDLPAGRQVVIFTPNPEQITAASKRPELKKLLNEANIALPDGVGVVLGSKLLGTPIKARVSGVDFMEKLLAESAKRPVKSGFFGGQSGVAEEAAKCLSRKAGSRSAGQHNITISYASDVYDKAEMIKSNIDILFVGLGFPKQEEWIMAHKNEIPATVFMAVGGSFDFLSGKVLRAPKPIQNLGLEWLFRLIRQPWRVKRQARLLNFSALILAKAVSNHLKKTQNS